MNKKIKEKFDKSYKHSQWYELPFNPMNKMVSVIGTQESGKKIEARAFNIEEFEIFIDKYFIAKEDMNGEYIVTDGCMWEKNKKEGTKGTHAIEVVDIKTGQIRYIKGGSQIKLISGEITKERTQEVYNAKNLIHKNEKA